MAHSKKAYAMLTHPRITGRGWGKMRRKATSGASSANLSDQARLILGGPLDPDKYLFSHCTIVASVDIDPVPGVRMGTVKVGNSTIDRRYGDYYIRPTSSQYVNNNGDSWSRPVLLASYPTFVGGHNFLEHVQVASKSKGRIIDAVARDVGDSVYIDILVATNRKHASLISDIKSGRLNTLSMGCTTDFTICTKCGHVAVDETDLCDHVKVAKLDTFLDERNERRIIAELCGHISHNETGGVNFIEASWVGIPAFTGAVMRNILQIANLDERESEIRRILASQGPSWSEAAMMKAAKFDPQRFLVGQGDEDNEDQEPEPTPEPETKDTLQKLEDDLVDRVKDRVQDRLRSEMRSDEGDKTLGDSDWPNDTLNREARTRVASNTRRRYKIAVETALRHATSQIALVDSVARINIAHDIRIPVSIYRAALEAGSSSRYAGTQQYVNRMQHLLGRRISPAEFRVVVRVGSLLSQWEQFNNPQSSSPRSS